MNKVKDENGKEISRIIQISQKKEEGNSEYHVVSKNVLFEGDIDKARHWFDKARLEHGDEEMLCKQRMENRQIEINAYIAFAKLLLVFFLGLSATLYMFHLVTTYVF